MLDFLTLQYNLAKIRYADMKMRVNVTHLGQKKLVAQNFQLNFAC